MKFAKTTALAVLFSVILFSGCQDDPLPPPQAPPTSSALSINSPYQAKFTLDGVDYHWKSGDPDFEIVHSCGWPSPVGSPSYYVWGTSILTTGDISIGFSKGTYVIPNGGFCSDQEFDAFYPTGSVNYSADLSNGVEVKFYDGVDTWSTAYGSADQTGSAFKIEAKKDVTPNFGEYTLKLYITFNCKLYLGGTPKILTDGVLIISISNC